MKLSEHGFDILKEQVHLFQDEKRFSHTLAVVKEAEYIALACGMSEEYTEKAKIAALLHDITKKFTDEEQREMFVKYKIDIPSAPPTMHEKTGAYFARETFGKEIVDDEIFSAILCHTTAKANMSMLDMIIFIADFTEETRTHKSCWDLRAYLHTECEKLNGEYEKAEALLRDVSLKIIANTISFLALKKRTIDIRTIEAWNSIVS